MNTKFWKNTGWLVIGSVFKFVFSMLISILWARYLGPSDLGIINYVAAYTSFFIAVCGLGLNGVVVHELVNHKENGEILGTAIGLRLIVGIVSSLLMVIIVWMLDGSNPTIVYIAVLQAIQLPFCALDTFRYWYQRQLNSKRDVLLTSLAGFISAIYKVYILLAHKPVVWFALGTTIEIIILSILYVLSYRNDRIEKLRFSGICAKRMLKKSVPFLIASLTAFIYSKIDVVMIRRMLNSDELVGLYTVAITICGYVSFIPTAILDSARPLLIESKNVDQQQYEGRMRKITLGIVCIAVLYSAAITLLGGIVLEVLYGAAYSGALTCLRIAVWYTAFSYLGGVKSVWLLCEKKNKYVSPLVIMGAVTNIILNAILIPYKGIEGAAYATLITQMLSNVVYPMFFKETRGFTYMVMDAIRLRGTI